MKEDINQELAPLGSSDSELETDDSSKQEPLERGNVFAATLNSPSPGRETEDMSSLRHLRILLFALCSGIQTAAQDMDTEPKLIRTWLQDKEKKLEGEGVGCGGEAVERLVEWILVQREQQRPIREESLFQKAYEIHSQTNESSSFRISYDWAVTFMLRHKLGLHDVGMPAHRLPCKMQESCDDFKASAHRQIRTHGVALSALGAMDQLSVFVDFDRLVRSTGPSRDSAFRLEGTGKPWMNVYLAVLADGTVLPTVMFIKGTHVDSLNKGLSGLVKLEASIEGFSEKEELDVWVANVWRQYLNSQNATKAILIVDGHHSHMTEGFLSALGETQTVPMVIPSGCSNQRQPLEMCVIPVLKRFLLRRWSHFATQNGAAGMKSEDLARLLVSWLEEALACCSGRPQIVRHSFCYSGLIAEHEAGSGEVDAQLKHLDALTEAMLGPEAIESLSREESKNEHGTRFLDEESSGVNEEISDEQAETEINSTAEDGTTETEEQLLSERRPPALPQPSPSQVESSELLESRPDFNPSQTDVGSGF